MTQIRYTFHFAEGRREEFDLHFDEDFQLVARLRGEPPEWTRLELHHCEGCPLSLAEHSHCPLAMALADPVVRLGNVISYEPTRVEVVTPERTVRQETTAQDGISALLGLINATSGCPVTAFFRPMARFHLPFASEAETLYRAASMYLLGEYFRTREGCDADLELHGLLAIYRNLEKVNRGIVARIRASRTQDGALNAIVLLDLYAKSLPYAIEESLVELKPLFAAYLRCGNGR
jgi:hypothetical protein